MGNVYLYCFLKEKGVSQVSNQPFKKAYID